MAGVVLTDLSIAINKVTSKPAQRIVRSMPNTPVKVRKGSVAVTISEGCSAQDREVVFTIFSSVGRCVEIPERLQNSFAAMAGSGPAYIYQVLNYCCNHVKIDSLVGDRSPGRWRSDDGTTSRSGPGTRSCHGGGSSRDGSKSGQTPWASEGRGL